LAALQQQHRFPQQKTLSSLLGEQTSKDSYAGLHLQNLFAQLDSRGAHSVNRIPQSLHQEQQLAPNQPVLQSLSGQSTSNIHHLTGLHRASLLSKLSWNNSGLSDLFTRSQSLLTNPINSAQMNIAAPVSNLESSNNASMLRVSSLGVGNRALLDLPSSMAQVQESSADKNDRKRPAKDFGEKTGSSHHAFKRQR
jgi:hypothetical protein